MLRKTTRTMFDFLMATDSYDVRRYLAIIFSAGGSITLTALLTWIIILLQGNAGFLFWIALGLLVLIGLHQTGFISLLVKRSIIVSKNEVQIVDRQPGDKDSGLVHPEPPQTPPFQPPYQPPYGGYPYNPHAGYPYGEEQDRGFSLDYDPSSGGFNMGYEPERDFDKYRKQP